MLTYIERCSSKLEALKQSPGAKVPAALEEVCGGGGEGSGLIICFMDKIHNVTCMNPIQVNHNF